MKRKIRKKSISILLAFTMLFTSICIPVFSNYTIKDGEETASPSVSPAPTATVSALPEAAQPSNAPLASNKPKTPEASSSAIPSAEPEPTHSSSATPAPLASPSASSDVTDESSFVPTALPLTSEEPFTIPMPELPEVSLFTITVSEGDISTDLLNDACTIEADGEYSVSGTFTNGIIIAENVTAELTIDSATIETSDSSPIKLEPGAKLTLHLVGENTLNAKTSGYAGIAVCATTEDDMAELIIDGDGTLNVSSTMYGAAIGANRKNMTTNTTFSNPNGRFGRVIINSGTINATAGTASAAIGIGNLCSDGGDIIINGGHITAHSTGGAGIGGYDTTHPASTASYPINITINSGYIKATTTKNVASSQKVAIGGGNTNKLFIEVNGGSINAIVDPRATVVNKNAVALRMVTLQMPAVDEENDIEDMRNKQITVQSWINGDADGTSYTDDTENGCLYVFVPDVSTTVDFLVEVDGVEYNASIDKSTDVFVLSKSSGEACSCNTATAKLKISDSIPSSITVNKNDGIVNISLADPIFSAAESCLKDTHIVTDVKYTIVETGTRAEIVENALVASYDEGSESITLKVTAKVNGNEYTASKTITIGSDDSYKFYLSDGHIDINPASSGDMSNMKISVGGKVVAESIPVTEPVYIEQGSNKALDRMISITGVSPTLVLNNINISRTTGYALILGSGVNLNIELIGDNTIYAGSAAVTGDQTSSKIIIGGFDSDTFEADPSGKITFTSGRGAGIGGVNKVIINGYEVVANGGGVGTNEACPGIGASVFISGNSTTYIPACQVEINGGKVYAYGAENAAGIGGDGTLIRNYRSGAVTINGGMVVAQSAGTGMGIGYGGRSGGNNDGIVTITGGSVIATIGSIRPKTVADSDNRTFNEYMLTLSLQDVSDSRAVEYTLGEGDDLARIPTYTDENGKLYLYLRDLSRKQWLRIYDGTDTYYYYTNIAANDGNNGTAVKAPTDKTILSFTVSGQIGETEIDNDAKTIKLEIPRIIDFNNVAPVVKHKGAAESPNGPLVLTYDESADLYKGTYTVIGHDLAEQPYSVEITPNGEIVEGPITLDISLGNVVITDKSVKHGLTTYMPSDDGYIIVGSSSTNVVLISAEAVVGEAPKKLPPVTLSNVTMNYSGSGIPVIIDNATVDMNIEGNCSVTSANGAAIKVQTNSVGSCLNITSENAAENILNVAGGTAGPAIQLGSNNTSVNTTDVALNVIGSAGNNAFESTSADERTMGKFYTDSNSYVNIVNNSTPKVKPMQKGSDGAADVPLYQLSMALDTEKTETSGNVCTYNGIEYYINDDCVLHIMVPAAEYNNLAVDYDGKTYKGKAAVNSANTMTTLYTVRVNKATPSTRELTHRGGDVVYTLEGSLLAGNVTLKYEDVENKNITGTAPVVQSDDGSITATLTFPANATAKAKAYNVYYIIGTGMPVRIAGQVTVKYNDGICSIDKFELDGQVKSEFVEDDATIKVYMPFDREFNETDVYFASVLEITGTRVTPGKNVATNFKSANTSRSYQYAYYTVEAESGDSQQYRVNVYKETAPNITRADFINPTTSNESTVKVTLSGTSLGNIERAKEERNRIVRLYMDGEFAGYAEKQEESGTVVYVANITVPANESSSVNAVHTLSAKIGGAPAEGDTPEIAAWQEFPLSQKIEVPRKIRDMTDIAEFNAEYQVKVEMKSIDAEHGTVDVVMPYDADLENVIVNGLLLEDSRFATYELYRASDTEHLNPLGNNIYEITDFSTPIECIVTAEDKVTQKSHIISMTKQAVPEITGVEFTNPETSHPGTVPIKVYGNNLENVKNAISGIGEISIYTNLLSGETANSSVPMMFATLSEDNTYATATLKVPSNPDFVNARTYEIVVVIPDIDNYVAQDNLVIRCKEAEDRSITAFKLLDAQDDTMTEITDNESADTGVIKIYVPYNTDLRNLIPKSITHSGVKIAVASEDNTDVPQDFNAPVIYKVTAESGNVRTYTVNVIRKNELKVTKVTVSQAPADYTDTENIGIDIVGNFIPDRGADDPNGPKDSVSFYAVCGEEIVNGSALDYGDDFGGHATGTLTLPNNMTYENKTYQVIVKVNGMDYTGTPIARIVVPRRTRRSITKFEFNGAFGSINNDTGVIRLKLPYDTDMESVSPVIEYDGDTFEMTSEGYSKTETPGEYSATYKVSAVNDTDRTYTAYLIRDGQPIISSVEFESPADYRGGKVTVSVTGTFFEGVRAFVTTAGGSVKEGTVKSFSEGSAVIEFGRNIITQNNDTENDAEYTLTFEVDGFDNDHIKFELAEALGKIIVSRRTARGITKYAIGDAEGIVTDDPDDDTLGEIEITVPYDTDMKSINPVIEFDGDACEMTADFTKTANRAEYMAKYTVSTENDADRVYTVYLRRDGQPTVSSLTFENPVDYRGGIVTVNIEGTFFDGMSVKAASKSDGSEIAGTVTFSEGTATAVFRIPTNWETDDIEEFELKFEIDGFDNDNITFDNALENIVVPRRESRTITEFSIDDIEGTITEDAADETKGVIRLALPYDTDLDSINPEITTDGGECYQSKKFTATGNRAEYSAEYIVSSEIDDPRTYTVYITREGQPTISGVTITSPSDYVGGKVSVDIEGIFFDGAKVTATANDGTVVSGSVTPSEDGKARIELDIPRNTDTTAAAEYDLAFEIDGFDNDSITLSGAVGKITVPRRSARSITSFSVGESSGIISEADENTGTVRMSLPYNTDLGGISPTIEIDGDECSFSGSFVKTGNRAEYSAQYTVSRHDDTDRTYTVYITRDGQPTVSDIKITSPEDYASGLATVEIEGIFFDSLKVKAVAADGTQVDEGTITFAAGKAQAKFSKIPANMSTTERAEYTLVFEVDGFDNDSIIFPVAAGKISVPRRTTRELKLSLPDGLQEGETRYDGTDITIDVPYCYLSRLTSVVPVIESFDAESISPKQGEALNFSDPNKPVTFTLSSSGETADLVYTVHIHLIGEDPYIESFTVENQDGSTEYEGDTIKITMPSNADLTSIEPVLKVVPEDSTYTPYGAPVDFSQSGNEPVEYIVTNKYGISRKYYVTIDKKSSGSGKRRKPKASEEPTASEEPAVPTEAPEMTVYEPYINGYSDGGTVSFRPDNSITRAEIAKILSLLDGGYNSEMRYQSEFTDVEFGKWYSGYVDYAAYRGYIKGYEDKTARPDNNITRAEFAAMAARFAGIAGIDGEPRFTDMDGYEWSIPYINALSEREIIDGYKEGTFRPGNNITRAEAVTIINRLTVRVITDDMANSMKCPFNDVSKTHWAYNNILAASEKFELPAAE